jgi:hypothetical protein
LANHPVPPHDLPRNGRHQVLERPHHGLEPARNFLISGFEAAGTAPLGIEIGKQPVTLFAQETDLVLQGRDRDTLVGFSEHMAQEALELINGCIEPLGRLLQSVRLAHRAPPPSSGAALVFASHFSKLLDPRINVNVVTAHVVFNNRGSPLLVPAHAD